MFYVKLTLYAFMYYYETTHSFKGEKRSQFIDQV